MNRKKRSLLSIFFLLLHLQPAAQMPSVNWNQFRGPNGQGRADTFRIPIEFGPDANVLWKTSLPPGKSSPVICNDRIFLTAFDPDDTRKLSTLSIDRKSGRILWTRTVHSHHNARLHPTNDPASPTPAVDPDHVYVYFGTYGLICFDHEGDTIWERLLKPPRSQYGAASSPILYKDKVILLLDEDGTTSRLLALKKKTGETALETPRPLFRANWSTPMIWHHAGGDELVVLGSRRLTSYEPGTGKELWWAGGFCRETVGVPVFGEGLLFASASAMAGRGDEKWDTQKSWSIITRLFDANKDNKIARSEMTKGFTIPIRPELSPDNPGWGLPVWDRDWLTRFLDKDKDGLISEEDWTKAVAGFSMDTQPMLSAIRSGAEGNARPAHVAWELRRGIPETPSLLYLKGRLYLMRDGGLLTCVKASSGEELFRKRIRGAPGQYIASPVAARDQIIVASVRGRVAVIEAADELKVLAVNRLEEKIYATPAIAGDTLYIRTEEHLYAFGRTTESKTQKQTDTG